MLRAVSVHGTLFRFLWRHGIAARLPKNSLQSNDKGPKI